MAPEASNSLGLGINHGTHALASYLQNPIRRAGSLDHLRPIGVEMNHRLFAVHILACLHGIHGNLLVPMVRRADDNRVDVLASQHLRVVARGEDIVSPKLLAMHEPPVIAIGNSDELYAWDLDGRLRISHALPASPNQSDLNVIVGCNLRRRLALNLGKHMRFYPK